MTDATPDTVYICSHSGEYGRYYPEAVEAEGALGGQALEYTRARPMTVAEGDVNKLAEVLMAEWKRADPNSNVAQYMTSYVATFADMARAALRALSQGGE